MGSLEAKPKRYMKRTTSLFIAATATTASLSLASCGGSGTATQPTRTFELKLNMKGFLKPGSSDTCFNGGSRQCALLLRTRPELTSQYLNANSSDRVVAWPLEAYLNKPADVLTVTCYDPHGEVITPYEGTSSSPDWYKVLVPLFRVRNQAVLEELRGRNPAVETTKYQGHTAVIGWASIEWFNQSSPSPAIPECQPAA